MIRVFFFLWTTTIFVLANAAPQGSNSVVDGNDPTEAEQSFLGSEFSISSLGDSSGDPQDSSAMTTYPPQDAFYVADAIDKKDTANSTNIECHSDTSTNNFWYEDNDQKRSISKRGKACSTDTMTTTKFSPTITYPELWQQEPKDKTTPRLRNPCANLGTKQTLLSCGGPIFPQGNSMNVLNCVLGVTNHILQRLVFPTTWNVAQFCCFHLSNAPVYYYTGSYCEEITPPPIAPLEVWTKSEWYQYLRNVDKLRQWEDLQRGIRWNPRDGNPQQENP